MGQKNNELEQIDLILQSALMRPASQRESFLEEACAGNPTLRLQVEQLLAHLDRGRAVLKKPLTPRKQPDAEATESGWKIGDRIDGRWEVRNIFGGPGSSGMGIVYIVYDHESHEVLAAKTFQDRAPSLDPGAISRFNLEALAWVKLDRHQNITRAHAVRTIDGKPFLFLEFITGGDLAAWIGTPRLVNDQPQALRFALNFCDGMIHAQAKGIQAHRDIKPQNCLITHDRMLKITDFGLVKAFDELSMPKTPREDHDDASGDLPQEETMVRQIGRQDSAFDTTIVDINPPLTRTGAVFGTLPYMAPEQFRDAKHIDVRADVYSFGVMLFEMITGERPFKGRDSQEYLTKHQSQPPPPLRSGSQGLDSLVAKCLAKDRINRFQDFREVRSELGAIFEQLVHEPVPEPIVGKELLAEEYYNKGLSLANLGYVQAAIDCYEQAIALKPNYSAAWNNKAIALDSHEDKLFCLEQALACDPLNEPAWYNKGVALTNLGRAGEAFACYDRAVELNPLNDKAWNDRGATLSELGRVDEALRSYDRALAINPANEKVWLNKANALRNSDRHNEALVSFDEALKIDPALTEALRYKGVTLSELGRHQEALACFDRILDIGVLSADAWADKGRALRALRRAQEALRCYESALQIAPHNADIWSDKGSALGDLGQSTEALACFDQAIKLTPQHERAWYNKANELRNLGRLEEAIDAYSKALEVAPSLYQASVNKGLTLAAAGRLAESLECYDRALEFAQSEAAIWFNRGNSLFQMKRADEAIASYDRALDLDPQAAQIWNNKGAALVHGFRNYRDALFCFERAHQLGDANALAVIKECQRYIQGSQ